MTKIELTRRYKKGQAQAGGMSAAWARHQARAENRPLASLEAMKRLQPLAVGVIGLGGTRLARPEKSRARNWVEDKALAIRSVKTPRFNGIDCGRYSSRCSYSRMEYRMEIRSYAVVRSSGLEALIFAGDLCRKVRAPRGYTFATDGYGFKIVNAAGDDYHPTFLIVRDKSPTEWARRLRENAALRRDAIAAEAKRQNDLVAELDRVAALAGIPVIVSIHDSRRAGNCVAGTYRFCDKMGLSHKSVPAKTLLRIAKKADNYDRSRIIYAIRSAVSRLEQSLQTGVSPLGVV
jgi:hypothetical protein